MFRRAHPTYPIGGSRLRPSLAGPDPDVNETRSRTEDGYARPKLPRVVRGISGDLVRISLSGGLAGRSNKVADDGPGQAGLAGLPDGVQEVLLGV